MFHHPTASRIWAFCFIAIGAVLLLANFGYIAPVHFRDWWPVIFILIGVRALLWPRSLRACRRAAESADGGRSAGQSRG